MVTSILVISLFIIAHDTIGETKDNNKWHSTQETRTPKNSPIDCDGVQLTNTEWDSLCLYIYVQ